MFWRGTYRCAARVSEYCITHRVIIPGSSNMAQRSITAFFMPKAKKADVSIEKADRPSTPEKSNGNLSDEPDGDSPVKKPHRRRPVIDSDSDDEGPSGASASNGSRSPKKNAASSTTPCTAGAAKAAAISPQLPEPLPLRKTARKTHASSSNTEEKQLKMMDKLKTFGREDLTKANGRNSAAEVHEAEESHAVEDKQLEDGAEETGSQGAAQQNGNAEEEQSNGDDSFTKIAGKPSVKTYEKSKPTNSKLDASHTDVKAQKGVKRKSSDEPGAKTAKKERTIASDSEEDEKKDEGVQDQEMRDEGGAKVKEVNKEKQTVGGKQRATGIFGLQKCGGGTDSCTSTAAADAGYDPSKKRYHPVHDATWREGEKVPFLALARTFDLIEATSARLKMAEILANYYRSVIALSAADLLPSVYLCLNKLAPAYEGVELGIGEQIITKAIAGATGRTADKIKTEAAERGDLGLVAEASRSRQKVMFRPAPLTVQAVFKALKDIARMSGHAAQAQKVGKIQGLLVACRGCETRFIVRALSGKLRIGLAEQSALQALAHACTLTPPEQERPVEVLDALRDLTTEKSRARLETAALTLKTTYCECPSYDQIVPVLLQHGLAELPHHCSIQPGVPLKPMLAHPTRGVSEVLSRFEDAAFTCEYKYDGERAQIHLLEDGSVRIYSRNQEDNTSKYPDITARFSACLTDGVKSCILDSEAVAWDTEKQSILPFQVLSTRKRKDASADEIKVKVCVFAFDLLMLNGDSLVKEPFQARRDKLKASFREVDGEFTFAKSNDSTNVEDIAEFLDESIKGNCEGLMVKTLLKDATYEIAKRSRNWLKLKKDYLDGVGDTIDVAVIGGFLGKGKRAGKYGGFLLACYDPDNEEFQSVCKIGTGFSDDDLQTHSTYFSQHRIDTPKPYYRYAIEPDHWFDATQVWEIKCADLSISPVHKAAVGIVDPEKGISLRFPRFLRIREDKEPEAATSAQQIASMYRNQDQVKNQASGDRVDEEDFY